MTFRTVLLITLFLLLSAIPLTAQPFEPSHLVAYFTDYADGSSRLLRYDLASRQISVVSAQPDLRYAFSNDQQQVTFWDTDHLWLSSLSQWNPTLLVTKPDLNIDDVKWMPDDSRLILSLNPQKAHFSRTFDFQTYRLLNWNWTSCATFVQNVRTLALGILCSVKNDLQAGQVFLWGGSTVPFTPDQFRILTFPANRGSWNSPYWVNKGRTLGYMQAFNPEALVSSRFAGHLFFDVAFQSRQEPTEVISGARSDVGSRFALTADGTLGAFLQDSGGGNYHYLHIFSTETGQPIGKKSITFESTTVENLVWSPDNQKLFIHKFAYPTTYLSIVDVASGTIEDHALSDDYGGELAIVSLDT